MPVTNPSPIPEPTITSIQEQGRVILPPQIRRSLGLKTGDLVTVTQTPLGVLITPHETVVSTALADIGHALKKHGLSLEELIERGRRIRTELLAKKYGITAMSDNS